MKYLYRIGYKVISFILLCILASGNVYALPISTKCDGCSHCNAMHHEQPQTHSFDSLILDRFIHNMSDESRSKGRCVPCANAKHSSARQNYVPEIKIKLAFLIADELCPYTDLHLFDRFNLTHDHKKVKPAPKAFPLLC